VNKTDNAKPNVGTDINNKENKTVSNAKIDSALTRATKTVNPTVILKLITTSKRTTKIIKPTVMPKPSTMSAKTTKMIKLTAMLKSTITSTETINYSD